MAGSWERLRPGRGGPAARAFPFPPELAAARFPSNAPLIGPVALAVDSIQSHGGTDGRAVTFSSAILSEGIHT